jgi:acylglycerol lipase
MKESPSEDKTLIFKENMWHNAINEEEIYEIIP